MEFIVVLPDGSHKGPLDQETLRKWVEIDKVTAECPVRNAMVSSWKQAREFDFLHDALEAQAIRFASRVEEKKGFFSRASEKLGFAKSKEPVPQKEVSSAFKYEYLPNPPGALLRLCSGLTDLLLVCVLAVALLVAGMALAYMHGLSDTKRAEGAAPAKISAEELAQVQPQLSVEDAAGPSNRDDLSKGFRRGSLWNDTANGTVYSCLSAELGEALWCERSYLNALFYKLFAALAFATLFYYGFSLGFFAQTFGMWFWGILIVRNADEKPVFAFRAFLFSLLLIAVGFLTPIIAFVLPSRRSLHDMLAGVRLIGIAAKPKT